MPPLPASRSREIAQRGVVKLRRRERRANRGRPAGASPKARLPQLRRSTKSSEPAPRMRALTIISFVGLIRLYTTQLPALPSVRRT
jgi:hypothetical protein